MKSVFIICLILLAGCDSRKVERERLRAEEIERSRREFEAGQKAITNMNHHMFGPRTSSEPTK